MKTNARLGALLCTLILLAAAAPVTITGQLLAYQDGYAFFTTGDGFRVAPNVAIRDYRTGADLHEQPVARDYARAVFNDVGQIVEIDLSQQPLPVGPLPDAVHAFAVTLSTPYPDPDLGAPTQVTANGVQQTFSGKMVLVKFQVQVPAATPLNAQVFIATDASGWNPQAIQMDRVDALHFVAIRRMASGTILHFLYTRGTLQTEEVGQNGLSMRPHVLTVSDLDTQSTSNVVAAWADASGGNLLSQPSVFPTPYNPAPFPNLPPGTKTPHP